MGQGTETSLSRMFDHVLGGAGMGVSPLFGSSPGPIAGGGGHEDNPGFGGFGHLPGPPRNTLGYGPGLLPSPAREAFRNSPIDHREANRLVRFARAGRLAFEPDDVIGYKYGQHWGKVQLPFAGPQTGVNPEVYAALQGIEERRAAARNKRKKG